MASCRSSTAHARTTNSTPTIAGLDLRTPRHRGTITCLAIALLLSSTARVPGEEILVPDDSPSIQQAIDAADDGDSVVVASGIYFEQIDLAGKAITLRSIDGPNATIIDASSGLSSVVRCISGEGSDTMISGFTLTGGVGTLQGQGARAGGGIYIHNSSPTITDCVLAANDAALGGGIAIVWGSPTIRRCRFKSNAASSLGGGVYAVLLSYPILSECTFESNFSAAGGGIYAHMASPIILRSRFSANLAETGGGLMCAENSYPQLTSCQFDANAAAYSGGAIAGVGASPILVNCTVAINSAATGGGLANLGGGPSITNSIFWGNGPDDLVGGDTATVSYSLFEGGFPGTGNVSGVPDFIDPVGPDAVPGTGDENLGLAPGSPAIDTGSVASLPWDILDDDEDGFFFEPAPFDLLGGFRVLDDPETPDSGPGGAPTIDLGAIEFAGPQSECPSDLNADGVVNAQDLMLVLLNMGPCTGKPCHDVNGDGQVDSADLTIVLTTWGFCDL